VRKRSAAEHWLRAAQPGAPSLFHWLASRGLPLAIDRRIDNAVIAGSNLVAVRIRG